MLADISKFVHKQIEFEGTFANLIYSCELQQLYHLTITLPELGITLLKTNIFTWDNGLKVKTSDGGPLIRANVMPISKVPLATHEMAVELKAGDLVTAMNDDDSVVCDIHIMHSNVTDISKYVA